MNRSFQFVRKIVSKTEHYEEETLLSNLSAAIPSQLLDIFCFGNSLFRAGAVLPICSGDWVIQYQLEGEAEIRSSEGNCRLRPGDLLVVPPKVVYTYRVPLRQDVRKCYLMLRSGPLPEILLGREIRRYGMKVTTADSDCFRKQFTAIGETFANLDADSQKQLSVLLYELVVGIQNIITENIGNSFYCKLREAAARLQGKKITLENLTEIFSMGKHTLIREFRKKTGSSPVAYMIRLRLQYAGQLLLLSDMSIREIADTCGYSSASFFISDFKKHTGFTPGEYRASGKNSLAEIPEF